MIGPISRLFADSLCPPTSKFLGFPNWYRHLDCGGEGFPKLKGLNQVWIVVANLVEIALRVAGLVAVVMFIVGGIMFLTSRGEPDQTKKARDILWNATFGLIIAIIATTIVSFIAGRF